MPLANPRACVPPSSSNAGLPRGERVNNLALWLRMQAMCQLHASRQNFNFKGMRLRNAAEPSEPRRTND